MLLGIAAVLKAVAWPVTVLVIIFLLRGRLRDLVAAVADQIKRASKMKFRGAGITLELAGEVLRGTAPAAGKPPSGPAGETEEQEFTRLVREYEDISDPDPAKRAALRHPIADRLGHLAVSLKRRRSALATGQEGDVVALAAACVISPSRDDLAALETATTKKHFKYTAYRIGLALVQVLSSPKPRIATLRRVDAALDALETNSQASDDPALLHLIDTAKDAAGQLLQAIR